MSAEDRIEKMGLALPPPPGQAGTYVPGVQVGSLLFVSGCVPRRVDGSAVTGVQGYDAARLAGLAMLSRLRLLLGSLDRVKRVVKVLGMVNAASDFVEQPKVVDGFSDLMVEVFGDSGRGARAAVGMATLSGGVAVEIEMIVELYA
jgi:enamine deaminase RidA (YjgF/YER057c/UK114 family)